MIDQVVLDALIDEQYQATGISRDQVDTEHGAMYAAYRPSGDGREDAP